MLMYCMCVCTAVPARLLHGRISECAKLAGTGTAKSPQENDTQNKNRLSGKGKKATKHLTHGSTFRWRAATYRLIGTSQPNKRATVLVKNSTAGQQQRLQRPMAKDGNTNQKQRRQRQRQRRQPGSAPAATATTTTTTIRRNNNSSSNNSSGTRSFRSSIHG